MKIIDTIKNLLYETEEVEDEPTVNMANWEDDSYDDEPFKPIINPVVKENTRVEPKIEPVHEESIPKEKPAASLITIKPAAKPSAKPTVNVENTKPQVEESKKEYQPLTIISPIFGPKELEEDPTRVLILPPKKKTVSPLRTVISPINGMSADYRNDQETEYEESVSKLTIDDIISNDEVEDDQLVEEKPIQNTYKPAHETSQMSLFDDEEQ